jgi:hypothetical protein
MSFADAIPGFLATRTARAAALAATRAARDAYIQAAFPAVAARFEALLDEALGRHSCIRVTVTPTVETVQGRTFATLNQRVVRVRSTLGPASQTVTFTPQLAFREADQFGLIACAIDFAFVPRRARADATARALVDPGIQVRGRTVSRLLLPVEGALRELGVRDLEDAFTAWWLR